MGGLLTWKPLFFLFTDFLTFTQSRYTLFYFFKTFVEYSCFLGCVSFCYIAKPGWGRQIDVACRAWAWCSVMASCPQPHSLLHCTVAWQGASWLCHGLPSFLLLWLQAAEDRNGGAEFPGFLGWPASHGGWHHFRAEGKRKFQSDTHTSLHLPLAICLLKFYDLYS